MPYYAQKEAPMQLSLTAEPMAIFQAVGAIVQPVYLVGGSVRDLLRGQPPHDYDFATPLLPDDVEAAVRASGAKPHIIGKRFGTIGFKIGDHSVEVTTFRTERYTPGSRKPDVTYTTDLTYDLSRRDFTINAMALRADGHVVDPFGGASDLRDRIIRTVNKPYDRYHEDPLRMLRAARFAAQLGFVVDTDSEKHAAKKADLILTVSKERWVSELDKLLVAANPTPGLEFLAMTRLLHFILPELAVQIGYQQHSPYHQLDLWQHTLKTVRLSPPELTVRWAALLHDVGKPFVETRNRRGYSNYAFHDVVGAELVRKIGHYLKWSKDRTTRIAELVRNHIHDDDSPLGPADADARFAD